MTTRFSGTEGCFAYFPKVQSKDHVFGERVYNFWKVSEEPCDNTLIILNFAYFPKVRSPDYAIRERVYNFWKVLQGRCENIMMILKRTTSL